MNSDETHPASVKIPIIDFARFLTGNSAHRRQVAQEIFQACHKVGFLYLKNHGIPSAAIERAFLQSRIFFELPLIIKQQIAWSNEHSNRGYIGIERECLDETQAGDLKEAFNIGQEPSSAADGFQSVTNRWPAGRPLLRQTINELFEHCSAAAEQIFQAFAYALSMPADYFVRRHQTHDYTLRLLHYPPIAAIPKPGQLRAGAHSDYGSLTLLFQDNVGGLEVQNADGDWLPAPTVPNTLLINTGDLMQRWSNNEFRSTKHRVRLPEVVQTACIGKDSPGEHRYSIAFFCQPDAYTNIVCLPTCHNEQNPPQYPPIKSGDYLLRRLRATY
ncbi:MAG: 2-oxoglutarate and iron-dependent oxygenase domain-containing protein [Cyanobacteria bacterium P01_F01_bin.116]